MTELSILGSKTPIPQRPEDATLETFENPAPDQIYLVPFVCTEFTSLCPKTGQPDFAELEIVYVPRTKMVESKALKLYLFAFRNEGSFHEAVVNRIFQDLWKVLDPLFLRVYGDFNVRGGIAIKPMIAKFAEGIDQVDIKFHLENWDRVKPT